MKKINTALLLIFIVSSFNASSQDRYFARTYQSITLPKGVKDLEVWNTYRSGRNYFYNRIDQRIEFEIGLTDKLQTALYLNASHVSQGAHLDIDGGITDTSASGISSGSEFSLSSEWKWRLSSPDANKVGFALYAEVTLAPNETELEGKIILDKRTEKNIFALNLVAEQEWEAEVEHGVTETETEFKFETDLAYMRMLKNNFGLGIELRNHNEFVESEWEHSALFGGPTLFFSGNKYFLILNILPQWTNLHKTTETPGSLVLNEHEKIEVRLLLGFGL
jgi:hypothetical protein